MLGIRGNILPLPLEIIEVIHAASINTKASQCKGVLNITPQPRMEASDRLEKRLRLNIEPITFGEDDLEGTSQPHDDALVMTSRIIDFFW